MRFQVEITQKMAAVVEINAPDEDAALQEANEMISKDIISSDAFHMEEAAAVIKQSDNILIFTRPANGGLQRKF
ncbi:hypothetical protein V1225_05060 [Emergencia sp. JLR.KK010]|uniref:hypothetical protein n=1 Tax=Emergencia sp. JLR.KK010 TaxID=3114296 RepID=UPI0030CB5416